MGNIISKLNLNKSPRLCDNNSLVFAKNIKLLKDGTIGRDDSIKDININYNQIISELTIKKESLTEELNNLIEERDSIIESLLPNSNVGILYDYLKDVTLNFEDFSEVTYTEDFTDENEEASKVNIYANFAESVYVEGDGSSSNQPISYSDADKGALDRDSNDILVFHSYPNGNYNSLQEYLNTNNFRIPVFPLYIYQRFKERFGGQIDKIRDFDYNLFLSTVKTFKTNYPDKYNNCFLDVTYEVKYLESGEDDVFYFYYPEDILKAYYYLFLQVYSNINNALIDNKNKIDTYYSNEQKLLSDINKKIDDINRQINYIDNYIDNSTIDDNYKIVGVIPYNTCFYLFLYDSNKSSYNSIIAKYDEHTEHITFCNCNWNYSGGTISGIAMKNLRGDEILNICEYDVNGALVPFKSINLSISSIYDDESVYTQASACPQTNFLLDGKFSYSIMIGTYQFFVRYEIAENVYTNWYPVTQKISIGNRNNKGTVGGIIYYNDITGNSDYSFIFNIEHVNPLALNLYKRFQVGFLLSTDNSQIARAWNHFDINYNLPLYFNPVEGELTEIEIEEMLESVYNLYNVKNIALFKNKLYISNYTETNFNLDFSELSKQIKIEIKEKAKTISDNAIRYRISYPLNSYGIDNTNVNTEKLIADTVISGIENVNNDSYKLNNEIIPFGYDEPVDRTIYNITDLLYNFLYIFNFYGKYVGGLSRPEFKDNGLERSTYRFEEFNFVNTGYSRIRKNETDYLNWNHEYKWNDGGVYKDASLSHFDILIQLLSDDNEISDPNINYNTVRLNAAKYIILYAGSTPARTFYVRQFVKGMYITMYLDSVIHEENVSDDEGRIFDYDGHVKEEDEDDITTFSEFIDSFINYHNFINLNTGKSINGDGRFTYTIVYNNDNRRNKYTFTFRFQELLSTKIIKQFVDAGDILNTTLIPLQTYKFFVHYINNSGEITNGCFIDELTIPYTNNAKRHYAYYPAFSNIKYPAGYNSCFFSVVHTSTKLSELFDVKVKTISYGARTKEYVTGNSIELDTNLIKIPENMNVVLVNENESITNITNKYHHSSDTENKFFFGQVGLVELKQISTNTNFDDYSIFAKFEYSKEEDDYVLEKCTPIINTETYDDYSALTLPGYICNVTKLIGEKNGTTDYYQRFFVAGDDVYSKAFTGDGDDDNFNLNLTSTKFSNDLQKSVVISTIYSNYDLNNLSLRFDPRDVVQIKESNSSDMFTIFDSLTLSDMFQLNSMYINYQTKTYSKYKANTLTEFNNTIRSSILIDDESFSTKYTFKSTDYYNTPVDKGNIVYLFSVANTIFVHTQDSLYKFTGDNSLSASGGEIVKLKETDVFDTGISAVLSGEFGFAGLKEKHHAIITNDVYIFYDYDGKNIYLFEGKPSLVRISDDISKLLKSYNITDIRFVNDIKNDRIFIQIYFGNDWINLSYDLINKHYISLHDFNFTEGFNTKTSAYFINSKVSENTLFKFYDNDGEVQYGYLANADDLYPTFNNDNPDSVTNFQSIVDVIINADYNTIKIFDYICWVCSKIVSYSKDSPRSSFVAEEGLEKYPGTKIQVYTDSAASDIIDLSEIQNNASVTDLTSYKKVRYNLGVWYLNYLRNTLDTNDKYDSDNRTLIYGKYLIVRFRFDSTDNFKLEDVNCNYKI